MAILNLATSKQGADHSSYANFKLLKLFSVKSPEPRVSLCAILFVANLLICVQSMSGIQVDDDVRPLFNDMKLRHSNKYATFKIEDKKTIVIDIRGDPADTESKEDDEAIFDDLKSTLTLEPRYILYDFGFTNKDGKKIKKLAFIFW